MEPEFGVNYTSFIRKLAVIKYFYKVEHLNFEEIGMIVDSREEIIQLYCKKLLNLKIRGNVDETRKDVF